MLFAAGALRGYRMSAALVLFLLCQVHWTGYSSAIRTKQQTLRHERGRQASPRVVAVLDRVNDNLEEQLEQIATDDVGGTSSSSSSLSSLSRTSTPLRVELKPAVPELGHAPWTESTTGDGLRFKTRTSHDGEVMDVHDHTGSTMRFRKDWFKTNKVYPFPYWSPTARKPGETLNHGTGACILAILPWIHMKKNSLNPSAETGVREWLNKLGGENAFLTVRNECILDDQCDAMAPNVCQGPAMSGMSLRPFCYRGYGDNACACGVSADHILHGEYCNMAHMKGSKGLVGPFPPSWMVDYDDKDEYKQIMTDVQKRPLVVHGKLPDSGAYGLIDHFIPFLGDWNPSEDNRKFPMWNTAYDKDKKGKNWEFCQLGFLPYTKCTRLWSTTIKQFFTEGHVSCSKDEDCYCRNACPGPLYPGPQFARWQPVCYTRGFNTCICALVSQIPTAKTCTHPKKHSHQIVGEGGKMMADGVTGSKRYMDIYYGGDEKQESPMPFSAGSPYEVNDVMPGGDDADDRDL